MFSLIIVIISIALVAALALATMYYGGAAFNKNGGIADGAKVLQEGNQLTGALELYKADKGSFPTGTSEDIANILVAEDYLRTVPKGDWEFRNDFAVNTSMTYEACLAINQKLGVETVPECSDPAFTNRSVCCSNP